MRQCTWQFTQWMRQFTQCHTYQCMSHVPPTRMRHGTLMNASYHMYELVIWQAPRRSPTALQFVALRCTSILTSCIQECCRILQCVAVCCSALHRVVVCCSAWLCVSKRCHMLPCVAVCCSVLQCVAACLTGTSIIFSTYTSTRRSTATSLMTSTNTSRSTMRTTSTVTATSDFTIFSTYLCVYDVHMSQYSPYICT